MPVPRLSKRMKLALDRAGEKRATRQDIVLISKAVNQTENTYFRRSDALLKRFEQEGKMRNLQLKMIKSRIAKSAR